MEACDGGIRDRGKGSSALWRLCKDLSTQMSAEASLVYSLFSLRVHLTYCLARTLGCDKVFCVFCKFPTTVSVDFHLLQRSLISANGTLGMI